MRVLSLDTAGPVVGVCLLVDGDARTRLARVRRGAEAVLMPWILELLGEAGLVPSQLDGIGVSRGPGAFTGLRLGLATAGGLSLGAGCPVWGGVSLHSRAERVREEAGDLPVLSLLDARKGRAYAELWRGDRLVVEPGDVPPEEALSWAGGPFLATGEGAIAFREAVLAAGGTIAREPEHPAVDTLARQAARALAAGEIASAEPLYLREPDARPPRLENPR